MEKGDGDTDGNQCTRCNHQRIGKRTGRLGNKNTSGENPNDSISHRGFSADCQRPTAES